MALLSVFKVLTTASILMICLPSQVQAYYTTNTGCHHNGTWYADKSLVPTTEKCLNCQCNKKTLVCRLKVCPEMPMPPPRGCVVVQKKNTCCPYLSCARLDAFYKIPATRRIIAYLDHYERESIDRVVNENMLQRRSDDTDVDLYVCVKNGTVYKSGSAMSSSNLCSYCYCIGGTEKCVKPKCMLPVEGCKPIFVDSTCCPVRYDCSSKQTGKSSQEVRYRKTSNKHYMRMSQRLQRNHGCTVGKQFYTEGQKMKSDKDKPCDICFCIRGQRKCAPKKCAPALRNCIPVVPKGQCCPSSYDCGSQRDYRRSQNSRQFNLFSLLFGKDDEADEDAPTQIPIQYPHDRDPVAFRPAIVKEPTTEKSFYDTIRESLEFIDSNNNHMLKDNVDLVDIPHHQTSLQQRRPSPTPIPLGLHAIPSTTEVSFLDLLLGPSEANEQKTDSASQETDSTEQKTTTINKGVHWVDLLLGPDEEDLKNASSTTPDKIDKADTLSTPDRLGLESTTSLDRLELESNVDTEEKSAALSAEQEEKQVASTTDTMSTTDAIANEETTLYYPSTFELDTTEQSKFVQPINKESEKATTTTTASTVAVPVSSTTAPTSTATTTRSSIKATTSAHRERPQPTKNTVGPSNNHTHSKPEKNSDFLAQLLDGLSDILSRENKTRQPVASKLSTNTTAAVTLPTPKPMPLFKPLPQDKIYTRINSKIANLTVRPPMVVLKDVTKPTFKPLPTRGSTKPDAGVLKGPTTFVTPITSPKAVPTTSTTTTTTATSTAAPITAFSLKPVVIKTNPTILESEPFDKNAEPTLPPSLPNLKIIPFLPTDAVKADHSQASSYEFYHHSSPPISRIDYDLYDDANLYPSITEKFPLYPDLEDGSKAEYIYKFNVEGPDSMLSSNAGKFDGTLGAPAFLKYDFAGTGTPSSTKGFSPPIKTEGGFVPKEPLLLDDDDHDNVSVKVGDSYHVTQHIIEITTASNIPNTTKLIEITTPDPFKDVIRTEPPPDLTSLIEDKLKNLIGKSNTTATMTIATRGNHINGQPQNTTTALQTNLKQSDASAMTLKSATQIKTTAATHIGTNNGINETQSGAGVENAIQHRVTQVFGDDMNDGTRLDVNDVSTIPPFKSLPTGQQMPQDNRRTASKESAKTPTSNKLKQAETTMRPVGSAAIRPVLKITTTTTTIATKRPAVVASIKANGNKTIALTATAAKQTQTKPTQINNNITLNGSAIKILASSTETSSSPSSAGTVSTLKTKPNATRRVTGTKPTTHHKPSTNTALPMATTKSTPKPNTLNVERTSGASRRTQKPTASANVQAATKAKTTSATTKQTTAIKSKTTIRTTAYSPSPTASSLMQRAPSTNPYFMSPFDKLPFMDASFEVRRSSAKPSITTAAPASSPQRFAVAATIATDALPDGAPYDPALAERMDDSFTSSTHNLMGLVHYKHTLNKLEGLEPATQQRPEYSASSQNHVAGARVSSHSATSSQQPPQSSTHSNLIDPSGILKLAGCNIYGRMYRVGRIILELSSPCLECKCTEIGVKCGPLDC